MREVSVIFVPEAQYSFISGNNDIGVVVSQRVTWKLGELSTLQREEAPESLAVVCRVQVISLFFFFFLLLFSSLFSL